jgi:hemin uptake protein HemP
MHKDAPPEARDALTRLARNETADLTPRARRRLNQRYLLTPEDSLAIQLFASWIEHYAVA